MSRRRFSRSQAQDPSACRRRFIVGASLAGWLAMAPWSSAATTPVPFQDFRKRTLEVTDLTGADQRSRGTDQDGVNLVWFGPADPDHREHGTVGWAIDHAIHEANQAGGVAGRPVRILSVWSQDPWGTGVADLFRSVYEDRPLAVLGSVDGATTHLAEQVVAKVRLPLVSPLSTDSSVTLAGVPWMFACAPSDTKLAEALVDDLVAESSGHAVLVGATDHDSRVAAQELQRVAGKHEVALDDVWTLAPGKDLPVAVIELLHRNPPAAVIVIAGAHDAARWVRTLRRNGVSATVLGWPSLGSQQFVEEADAAGEGVRFPLLFDPKRDDADTRRFVGAFRTRYGREPDYLPALVYDAAWVVIEAIRRGGENRAELRERLSGLGEWKGICGPIHWNGLGQNVGARVAIGEIRHGRVQPR